jgi:hypothetical protein
MITLKADSTVINRQDTMMNKLIMSEISFSSLIAIVYLTPSEVLKILETFPSQNNNIS